MIRSGAVLVGLSKNDVASPAQDHPHMAAYMAMVDVPAVPTILRWIVSQTAEAAPTLSDQHLVELDGSLHGMRCGRDRRVVA